MDSINCNRAVRSRWSFMPSVLLLLVGSTHFWAALYHPVLSKSRCIDCTKANSLNRRNLAIARPLLEVLFKAKGRTHAVTKEALRRTGDVINRLAKSRLLLSMRL